MSLFTYEGSDDFGKPRSGEVEAPGLVEAAHKLAAEGVRADELAIKARAPVEPTVRDVDAFVFFNRSLGAALAAGLPLAAAIRAVGHGLGRGAFRSGVERVEAALREGRTLAEALAREGGAFPAEYRMMIDAGAASGNLPHVLTAVASHAAMVRALRRGLATALVYPLLVVAMGLGVFAGVAWTSLGQFRALYAQFHIEAPPALLGMEYAFGSMIMPVAAIGSIATAMLVAWLVCTRTIVGERVLAGLPLLGPAVRGIWTMRFLGALDLLLTGRAPLAKAAPAAALASGRRGWARDAEALGRALAEARPLGDALGTLGGFSGLTARQLALGERLGALDDAVRNALERETDEVGRGTESLAMILEPLAIAAAAFLIGALFVGLVAPYAVWLTRMAG